MLLNVMHLSAVLNGDGVKYVLRYGDTVLTQDLNNDSLLLEYLHFWGLYTIFSSSSMFSLMVDMTCISRQAQSLQMYSVVSSWVLALPTPTEAVKPTI